MSDYDELDLFLQNWKPGPQLQHAILPQNLEDPLIMKRVLDDSSGNAPVQREIFSKGKKAMTSEEGSLRAYEFFQDNHAKWAAGFRDYVLSKNVSEENFDAYTASFANDWIDGKNRRQNAPVIMEIKASIRDFDLARHSKHAGRWVINPVPECVSPLFTPEEMSVIFDANSGLIDAYLPDYINHLATTCGTSYGSISDIYVRRGVYILCINEFRKELNYLSSYSLALGPVEQFAQTWTRATRNQTGIPTIFSAPLPAIQQRVVAFAPFIQNMDLSQLEMVVAPPVERVVLKDDGEHGNIRELSFR